MAKNEKDKNLAVKAVQDFLYPPGGITPVYAICEILQIPAYAVAEEIGVTRPQMSHYRKGQTVIPEHRMKDAVRFLQEVILDMQKEIAKERKKSSDKVTTALLADIERRIDLAKKIAGL